MLAYPEFRWSIEESLWDECVIEHTILSGADLEYLHAGLVSTIAQLILKYSCSTKAGQANEQLDDARMSLQDATQQAIIFICEAFPSYLPENLEQLTWNKLLKRLAQAEVILGKSFEFKDPASQQIDDSAKIFQDLNKFTEDQIMNGAIDFAKENQELREAEYGAPSGDYNLHRTRGR